jgi:spore germination protein KA
MEVAIMFGFFKKKRNVDAEIEHFNQTAAILTVSKTVAENLEIMNKLFADVDIMRYKNFEDQTHRKYAIAFSDGMVNSAIINEHIISPIMRSQGIERGADFLDRLIGEVVEASEAEPTDDFKKIVESVCYGDTILFVDDCKSAAILSTKSFPVRAVAEPDNEKSLGGPREGFTEAIMQNVSLIRRRARTSDLKLRNITVGRRTRTSVILCYLDEIVNRPALEELIRRIGKIDIDGVLDSNYLSELICDHRRSLFRTVGTTERPDVVVGKILEGRIAILVDGSPDVLTVPFLFIENFQASEDYYLNYYYTSFSRFIRLLGFFLTIGVPGFYIATVAFHHEMLPTPLLLNITLERQSVPLPAAVEAFVMLIVFEILRETGVRMPTNIGQALSIVGALVIGQAAVEAKLVAAPMIIVVGITGITNLLVPKIRSPIIYMRFFTLIMASIFGYYGFTVAMALMAIHIVGLTSFGVPMVLADGATSTQRIKDIGVRAPMWKMITRPEDLTDNQVRMANKEEE